MRKYTFWTWFSHCSLLLIPLLAQADTYVGGSVSGIWTPDGSPYVVTSSLIIEWGNTLLIKPDVEVQFPGPDSIAVYGTLIAQGTPEASIRFVDTGESMWQGICFLNGSSDECILEYVYIKKPQRGVLAQFCEPSIRYSTIEAQSVGVEGFYSDFTLLNSVIEADGQLVNAIYLYQSDATIRSDTIRASNSDPAKNVRGIRGIQSNPDIRNSVILVDGDGRSYGIDMEYASKAYVKYNLIHVTSKTLAYGVRLNHSLYPSFINNTVVVESDQLTDKCFYLWNNSNPLIENCILYGDGFSHGVHAGPYCEPTLRYDDIYNHTHNLVGCEPDTGCFSLDPLFIEPSGGDFHLTEYSPCIDMGNPDSPRDPDGSIVDVGCYYYHQPTAVLFPDIGLPADHGLIEVFPNPFNATGRLRVLLPFDQVGQLMIYDLQGRPISRVKSGLFQAGEHQVVWDASNYSSGIYWAVLRTDRLNLVHRIVLIK